MKAWYLEDINKFEYCENAKEPDLNEDEVLLEVKAAGICGSDVPRAYENGAHKMPLILGHEFAGQIVNKNADGSKTYGKRVGVFPLIPCKKCVSCQNKKYEMCSSYDYLGSRRDGAFAEYVAVPSWNLIELPDDVSYEQAAMLEPMAVAVHAMRRLDIKVDDVVAVCGLGTIGQLLTMFLLERGVKNILVIGSKDSQRNSVISFGIDESNFCDIRSEDVPKWIMNKTENKGVNAFFECVGKNETVNWALDLTAPAGQVCLVGNPHSDMNFDKNTYWKILRRQLKLTGTWNSTFLGEEEQKMENVLDDWHYVIDKIKFGKVKPEMLISHRLSLEELKNGLELMRDKSEEYTKVMVVF